MQPSKQRLDLTEADPETTALKYKTIEEENPDETVESVPYFKLYEGTPAGTKFRFFIGATHAFLSGTIFAVLLLLVGQIYDESTDEEEDDYDVYHESRKIAFCWFVLGSAQIFAGFVSSTCFTQIAQDVGRAIRKRYFHAILHKDISYFDKRNAAELPGKMTRDCDLIESGVGDKFMCFIEVLSFIVWCTSFSVWRSPQIYLVALCISPFILGGNAVFGYGMLVGAGIKDKAYIKAGGVAEESLAEVKTVASFNAQDYVSKTYNTSLQACIDVMAKMGFIKALGWGLTWAGWMLQGGILFWVPAKWISDERKNWIWGDEMEGPDVVVVFWEMLIFSTWLGQLAPGIAAYLEAKIAGARAYKFIDEPVEFVNGNEQITIEGRIEFANVRFAYPKHPDRDILNGLNFVCEKGQKTAIVGESGAGKSTIIQLMERFYEPSSGEVLFDGVPVKQFDIGYLRKQVGYVSQEPVLFNLTIEENLLLGNPSASSQDIEAAAKEANAFDFIISLQDGFLTNVGAKGSKLSGGQKQRIAIARAMIKKPKILLLDEATSALDNESEEGVLRALNAIHERQGVTMVSVAQKLSTVRNSDKIVVLRNGTVEEEGSHQELARKGGVYATMCMAQGMDIEETLAQMQEVVKEKTLDKILTRDNTAEEVSDLKLIRTFPLLRILHSMLPYWPLLIVATVSTIVAGLMFPLFGYFLGKVITYICGTSGERMEDNLRKFGIWMIIFSVITGSAFLFMGWSLSYMTSRLTKLMREQSFSKMLHLNAEYFENPENNSGLLSQNLNRDVELINDAGGPMIGAVLIVFVAYIGGTVLNFFWQWKLALVMTVVFPIQCFALLRAWMVRLSGFTHPQHQHATIFAMDATMNVKTLTAYEMQEQMESKYETFLNKAFEATKFERVANALWYGTGLCFIFWGIAISFWYGAYLEKFDEAEDEDVNIVCMVIMTNVIAVAACTLFAPGVPEASRAAGRIYKILDYKPTIDSQSKEGLENDIQGHIAFQDVSFTYQGRDNKVLQHITFELPMGRHIGITGASGSGKTTITQLLLRFYDPTEGVISIDGVDIRQYNIRHLRASIAMVGQEPVLFSGTIRSNVDFGLGKSDEDIKQALIHASIPRFADELDREVGTRGNLVSGGQKQRIAIARAILRSPKILLLDEATSALDTKTEKKILGALEYAGQGKTVLVIAHRLSTIEKCDEILVMDLGEIKERGTHDELKRKEGGIYQKLLAAVKS